MTDIKEGGGDQLEEERLKWQMEMENLRRECELREEVEHQRCAEEVKGLEERVVVLEERCRVMTEEMEMGRMTMLELDKTKQRSASRIHIFVHKTLLVSCVKLSEYRVYKLASMKQSHATQSLHLGFSGLRKVVACSQPNLAGIYNSWQSVIPASFILALVAVWVRNSRL